MPPQGIQQNQMTGQLLTALGRGGAHHVNGQQAAVTVLSAAVAAAGSMLMHTGAF